VYQGQSDNIRRGPPMQRSFHMLSESPVPLQSLTPDAALQASPLPHASPLLLSSQSLLDIPSS
jgi:hypothetical protein